MTDRFMNKLNQSPYTFSTLMNIVFIIITISLLILWEENVVWLLITTHFVLIILMVFNFVLMAIFTHKEYGTYNDNLFIVFLQEFFMSLAVLLVSLFVMPNVIYHITI